MLVISCYLLLFTLIFVVCSLTQQCPKHVTYLPICRLLLYRFSLYFNFTGICQIIKVVYGGQFLFLVHRGPVTGMIYFLTPWCLHGRVWQYRSHVTYRTSDVSFHKAIYLLYLIYIYQFCYSFGRSSILILRLRIYSFWGNPTLILTHLGGPPP